MLAFGLCLILFGYWTFLGAALLWLLESRMDGLRKLLLAPVVGMAVNGLPLFILNISGIPVSRSALPVGVVLLLGAVLLLWLNARDAQATDDSLQSRQPLWRQYLPFAGLFVVALVLTGRPMFLFNFDWMSFCNDDMANYCLGAHRVLDFGYFDRPDPEELVRGRDYVQQMWFLHVPGMHRPGSEMILAFVCAVTRKTAPEVFMVVILAMHLCQISALAALVYRKPEHRTIAWAAAALLSVSALASLGALYQLIAQVCGLALAIAAGVLLLRPMEPASVKEHVKSGTLIGLLIGALMIFYPEVFPFLALTWLIYVSIGLLRGRLRARPMLETLGAATIVTILALNRYTTVSLYYLFLQVSSGTRAENPQQTLFPYYLMPSGLANLWGLQPLATLALEPWQSLAIAVGALLLLAAGIAAVVWTWRGDANATFALVMVMMGLYLFFGRAGFGLYKLAMYSQPFFCALLVTAWLSVLGLRNWARVRAVLAVAPIVGLGVAMVCTQYFYVRSSCGVGQTFNEILDASDSRVYNEFRELVAANQRKIQPGHRHQYLVDTYNLVVAKFQSIGNRGNEMAFPSNRFYYPGGYKAYPTPRGQMMIDAAYDLMAEYNDQFRWEGFRVRGDVRARPTNLSRAAQAPGDTPIDTEKDGDASNTFLFNKLAAEMAASAEKGKESKDGDSDVIIVATTGKQSPFNRRHIGATPTHNFASFAAKDLSNHLVFVSSELGQPYFSGGRRKPNYAIYQLEAEPLFFRGRTMAGVGQHALFQIINPSKDPATGRARVRMMLDMTGSYKADNDNALPPGK